MNLDFQLHMRQFIALIIAVVVLSSGAEIAFIISFPVARIILYVCAGACGLAAILWLIGAISDIGNRQYVEQVQAETDKLNAASRAVEKLPEAHRPGAMALLLPEYGLDTIQIPPIIVQTQEKSGWIIQDEMPPQLATNEQYRRLAAEYFGNGKQARKLSVRYWTETQDGQIEPIFARDQFIEILRVIVEIAHFGTKDTATGVVSLNAKGEAWLGHYLSIPSKTDGFIPLHIKKEIS